MDWSASEFSFICYGNDGSSIFKEALGRDRFERSRLFEFTTDEIKEQYQKNLDRLSNLPALVVAESYPPGSTPKAFFCEIGEVEVVGRYVQFEFRHLYGGFNSKEVFDSNTFSGLSNVRTRTHWAVKQGSLPEKFFRFLEERRLTDKPKIFNVDSWPLPILDHVAVMMPFTGAFDAVYQATSRACGENGKRTRRVDEIYGPSIIVEDIFKLIVQSQMVVSDLTGRNPNVLYETGLAHARGCEVLMLTQSDDDIPFDLRHIRYIKYCQIMRA